MLRPATPLAVVLFAAFALLLVSIISTPIVKGIKLATFEGVDFGVFGYCEGSVCSGVRVGYNTETAVGDGQKDDFSLPASTRNSLSYLLVVHPVAAVFTLVTFVLSVTAHMHGPSHSPRYLLAVLILTLPTLLLTLLAFLVDILLFVPHMREGGWLVLVATILIAASTVLLCAMRRTLVGRKARQKRIAENAEMSGENFYNRQASSPPPLGKEPTAPLVNGAPGADNLPSFSTYEKTANGSVSHDGSALPNSRSQSISTRGGASGGTTAVTGEAQDRYGRAGRMGPSPGPGGRPYEGPVDVFGRPLPPSAAFGPSPSSSPSLRRDRSDPRLRDQYPQGRLDPTFAGGRGRGGYPHHGGRGGYGRGPPGAYHGPGPQRMNSDGRGMGPPHAGMMMAGGMARGGHRAGPPGYSNNNNNYNDGYDGGAFTPGAPGPYAAESGPYGAGYGRRPSPGPPSAPGYGRQPSPGPPSAPGYGRQPSPGPPSAPGYGRHASPGPPSAPGYMQQQPAYGHHPEQPAYGDYTSREPSPGPPSAAAGVLRSGSSPPPPVPQLHTEMPMVGQAIEMDATTGSPSPSQTPHQSNQFRDSDGDVRGMVGLQQNRQGSPLRQPSHVMSPTSVYSRDTFVPARAAWNGANRTGTPPLDKITEPPPPLPVELPAAQHSPDISANVGRARVNSGDNYHEDVDPRFAPEPLTDAHAQPQSHVQSQSQQQLPTSLTPGYGDNYDGGHQAGQHLHPNTDRRGSYEALHDMARSPAESDNSHYTSVSQRGVNPNWRPGPNQYHDAMPSRKPVGQGPAQRDVLLAGNNDFELPGGQSGGRSAGAGQNPAMTSAAGGGRYPAAI
ncbi:MAG: hypothetical protein M1825_003779 [Sarcosagium campestre]|nr:MAG: hypothetical protein M1825_003779 [Sarcosagium campestre]